MFRMIFEITRPAGVQMHTMTRSTRRSGRKQGERARGRKQADDDGPGATLAGRTHGAGQSICFTSANPADRRTKTLGFRDRGKDGRRVLRGWTEEKQK